VIDSLLAALVAIYWLAAMTLQVYGINCYVMIALFHRHRDQRLAEERAILERFNADTDDSDLPIVTTQLPIFNERNVIERLLRAVCAFDYPRDKHEIQVLDDSTDDTVEIAARLVDELRAAGHDVQHVRRTNRVGFKAGALDAGMKMARGEFLAVFDADFVPPPDFLRRTIPFLAIEPRCGFVQTRWGHRNRNFSPLTKVQAMGIDGHFVIEQSARSWNGLFFNFNGTAGVWRRAAIDDAGGWSADTLTEDLDLSYRTQLKGWTSRYLLDVTTPAEIPVDINSLKGQQHRWAKGSIQVAKKLLPTVWARTDLPLFKRLQATIHLTHYFVHPLMLIMTILVLPLLIWTDFTFKTMWMAVPIILTFVALFGPTSMYFISQRTTNPNWKKSLWLLPFLMSVGIGLAVNNTRAVLQGLFGGKSEFVRTPKLGAAAEVAPDFVPNPRRKSPIRSYRLRLHWLFLLEIAVGLWAFAAFVHYFITQKVLVSPILLLHAIGFTYIGVLSLMHDIRAKRHSS
jgi:cellulose synthase/poly-beta-1,6-N-acetylglucosamine synthase-like glycosyltransferase